MTFPFAVGDRVVAIHDIYPEGHMTIGSTGTVVVIDEYDKSLGIGVEWDSNEVWGHDLGGILNVDRGYWVNHEHLELIDKDIDLVDFKSATSAEISSFLGEILCLK